MIVKFIKQSEMEWEGTMNELRKKQELVGN